MDKFLVVAQMFNNELWVKATDHIKVRDKLKSELRLARAANEMYSDLLSVYRKDEQNEL